jgi:hypothetical protein
MILSSGITFEASQVYLFLGTMSLAEALRSLELFRAEVMPKLATL